MCLMYIVPTSASLGSLPPDDPLDVILLIWVCKSDTILLNN